MVESDRTVQVSTPFARIGSVEALLELLLFICARFRWYLMQYNDKMAKNTPITTPMEIPTINPDDSAFIAFVCVVAMC